MNKHALSDKFLEYLGKNDYSQAWLARKLGVARSTVNKWIFGANQIPPEKLQECCTLFAVDESERYELFVLAGYKTLLDQISDADTPLVTEQKAHDAILYTEPGNFRKPDTLFGRQALLTELQTLLDQGKHILLTGFGGTGKTAIAATIADTHLAAGKGAVLWASGGGGDDELFFEALLSPLGAQHELVGQKGDAQIHALRTVLAQSSIKLIILDDFQKADLLPKIRLALPPSIPLLITSRQDWANIDHTIKVTNLASTEACHLLAIHAQNSNYSFHSYLDDSDTRTLCAKMENHPLALVIAAAWLKQKRRKAGELLSRLDAADVTSLTLTMPPGFGEQGRESVAAMLDETFQLLSSVAHTVFRTLGALTEPHASAAFLAMCSKKTTEQVEDALDELAAWNFAEREQGGFYSTHDLLHSYAHMLFRKTGKPTHKQIADVVQQYVTTHADDFEELHFNLANILRIAEVANDTQCVAIVTPLAVDGYQDRRGHRLDYLRLLDRVIGVVGDTRQSEDADEHRRKLHYLLSKRGNAHFDRGEYAQAIEKYTEALHWTANLDRKVKLLAAIGKALTFQGNEKESQQHFGQAEQLAREDQNDTLWSFVLEQEAHAAGYRNDHETARRVAVEQVSISERLVLAEPTIENYESLFGALINWGTAEHQLSQKPLQEILAIHQRAEKIAEELQSLDMKAHAFWALAEDFHALGDRPHATHYLRQAYSLYEDQGKLRDREIVLQFINRHSYAIQSRDDETDTLV